MRMKKLEPHIRALRLLRSLNHGHGLVQSARHLSVSQSAASHMLAALERTLDAHLVSRSPRGLTLSETGQRLMPHVEQILQSVDAMRAEITGLAGLQHGTLRLAAVPSAAGSFLPRLLRDFTTRFSGIEVTLFEGTDGEVVDWIKNHMADVGFAALPVRGLACEDLRTDEWLAIVGPKDFIGHDHVSVAALARRPFLLSGGGCETQIRQLFHKSGVELPSHVTVKQIPTIQAMVAQGLGVSIVPALALEGRPKKTRTLSLSPRTYRHLGMFFDRKCVLTAATKQWLTLVKDYFSKTT
jgi:DNA-binding transcriptional LysR family regulator